jgi:hypothetical protein
VDPDARGGQAIDTTLQLQGWNRERRVVVMRRPRPVPAPCHRPEPGWLLNFEESVPTVPWEYAVVVCRAGLPLDAVPTLYAERADCENVLDELKNQWGPERLHDQGLETL